MKAPFVEKRTSERPYIIGGVQWESWNVGICQYEARSVCGRAHVWSPHHVTTYRAKVDGEFIGKRFRSRKGACLAAALAMKVQKVAA